MCSYHLQEAGATPVRNAFALATAIAVLDTVKASGEVPAEKIQRSGRPHSFVNAGLRSSPSCARCGHLLNFGTKSRASVTGLPTGTSFVPLRRAGEFTRLTEPQPENNVARILIEMLAAPRTRARAVQLPA